MKQVKFWTPTIIWMTLIFFFSSKQSVRVSEIYFLQFLFFKTLHLIEYAILFILFYWSLKNTTNDVDWKNRANAIIFSIVYAFTDEIHQVFVSSREGRLRDVGIDAIGILLGVFIIWKLLPKAPKKLKVWAKKLQMI